MFPDAREALKDLLNLKCRKDGQTNLQEAAAFISRHGPLRLFDQKIIQWDPTTPADLSDPRMVVVCASVLFRTKIVGPGPELISEYDEQDAINRTLSSVFSAAQIDGQMQPTALKVDILAGTVAPIPRDLLDAIAIEFMRSYKDIGQCERCQRFFVKQYSNDFYCSTACAEQNRKESQRNWMRNYRAKQKRKKQGGRHEKSKRRV